MMRVLPKIWTEGDVWIIGGGASLLEQFAIPSDIIDAIRTKEKDVSCFSPYLSALHDKHVIGVNVAFKLGDWVDILFFGDFKFFEGFRKEIAAFKGIKVSCHKRFRGNEFRAENIKYYSRSREQGLSNSPDSILWHGNSGAAAINFAIHLGVKRIFLLGFDMDLSEEGFQHFHNEYTLPGKSGVKVTSKDLPFKRQSTGFAAIASASRKLGVEIINVSPNSTINVFRKMTVKEALSYE